MTSAANISMLRLTSRHHAELQNEHQDVESGALAHARDVLAYCLRTADHDG